MESRASVYEILCLGFNRKYLGISARSMKNKFTLETKKTNLLKNNLTTNCIFNSNIP